MKIIRGKDVPSVAKPEGVRVDYYFFDEYGIHYNEQLPHTTQTWHYHEKVNETLFVIEGQLTAKWKEGNSIKEEVLCSRDLVEIERSDHTFENKTDSVVKFIVIKQVLSGEDKSGLLKNDKIVTK